jgi:hypothetical protein
MKNEQQPEPEKKNKIKQLFAFMTAREKKILLLIFFGGAILMFMINLLRIFLR